MTPEQWDRLKTVFQGALDQAPEARRAWLSNACAGDDALLREAQALLKTHDTAGAFLETPARVDPADFETLPPGTEVGPYRILDEIGRGGMGIVYLAEDPRLGRRVALKALPFGVAANPEFRERLRREARAAATISHPAVATVYALEEVDDHLIIVSEYVRGETLRSEIARGPIAAVRVRPIAIQIAGGLCAAHEAGVIHRDLKPENVLITASGSVKVVDFGIAHVEGPEGARLTRAGAILGTPAYMAPEQLLGSRVDARADLYAFGVLIAEMLAGQHPLSGLGARDSGLGVRDSGPDPRLWAIVHRCMQPDPAARYVSARELLDALEDESAQSTPTPHGRTPSPESRVPEGVNGVPPGEAAAGGSDTSRWWWEFHQAMAALVYWLMMVPVWHARTSVGGSWGRAFFIATLIAVIVAANLRLHLWFTSRFYPSQLRWVRRRTSRWIRAADWTFVGMLASGGLLIGDEQSVLAVLLLSVGVGTALAFLVIEPVTARAAFKGSVGSSP